MTPELNDPPCDLCDERPATVELSQGDYCEECASKYVGLSDYDERMVERRQMGLMT